VTFYTKFPFSANFFQKAGNLKKIIPCENDENSPQKQSLLELAYM
jgi:hypothetical protein